MKSIQGDLIKLALAGQFDVIIHGCNCQHTMGAGIAKSIRRTFPEAYEADLRTPKSALDKLGTISSASVVRNGVAFTVVNGYTQFHWAGSGTKADYPAIDSVMRTIKRQYGGARIGYPQIGAGLAGGDWEVISLIIDEALAGEDHTVVLFRP